MGSYCRRVGYLYSNLNTLPECVGCVKAIFSCGEMRVCVCLTGKRLRCGESKLYLLVQTGAGPVTCLLDEFFIRPNVREYCFQYCEDRQELPRGEVVGFLLLTEGQTLGCAFGGRELHLPLWMPKPEPVQEPQPKPSDGTNAACGNESTDDMHGTCGNESTAGTNAAWESKSTDGMNGMCGNESTYGTNATCGNERSNRTNAAHGNENSDGMNGMCGNESTDRTNAACGNECTDDMNGTCGNEDSDGTNAAETRRPENLLERHLSEQEKTCEAETEALRSHGELPFALCVEELFRKRPMMQPFLQCEFERCIRISLSDLHLLQGVANIGQGNSFLCHSYYRYRHLLLAKRAVVPAQGEEASGERELWLLAPGIGNSRERQMSALYGFTAFRSIHGNRCSGGYGYWCMQLFFRSQAGAESLEEGL